MSNMVFVSRGLKTSQEIDDEGKAKERTFKGYEEAINRLMKKVPEYQDLELNEIKFNIKLEFMTRAGSKREVEPLTIQDTFDSLPECMKFQEKWVQEKIREGSERYAYCKVQIVAYYYEKYKDKIITFTIPELSFEYDQD